MYRNLHASKCSCGEWPDVVFAWIDQNLLLHTYQINIEANTIGISELPIPGFGVDTELTISDIQWTDPPQPGFISDVQCTDLIFNLPVTATWTADSITITIPPSFPVPADIFCEFTAEHEEPPDDNVLVGGEIIPIESTSLLLAYTQSFSWMIPVVLSVLGIGLFVVSRKSKNS